MFSRAIAALTLALGLATGAPAAAADGGFAVIFNNSKNDGGFNESALKGLQKFKAETGIDTRENVIRTEEESIRSLRNYAQHGVTNILLIGFINEPAVKTVAAEFPNVHFTLIDGVVELPNVRSILFREDEAGYLAGYAAGLATRTGTVGFVGGMPIPPIRKFECGYIQGVTAARADAKVVRAYMGSEPTVFRDKDLGIATGKTVLDQGADIVFAAAGYGGIGALEAATQAGKLGIGVDTNQNGLFPGKILTSAVKRVDVAAYRAFTDAHKGTWSAGIVRLGLAEQGVDWARDADNEALVKPVADQVNAAANAIGAGTVTVTDYTQTPACQ